MSTEFGHWQLVPALAEENLEEYYGFLYRITNLKTGRKYLGKKQFRFKRKRKPLKNKKNCRRDEVESDWKTYCSSSNQVVADIEREGKEHFLFEIIRLCKNKFELSYFEAEEQFKERVLFREDYYNGIINLRVGKAPKYLLDEKF
jgi:hypothetical protein